MKIVLGEVYKISQTNFQRILSSRCMLEDVPKLVHSALEDDYDENIFGSIMQISISYIFQSFSKLSTQYISACCLGCARYVKKEH